MKRPVHITVILIVENQTLDKVHEANDVECDIPSSESLRYGIVMLSFLCLYKLQFRKYYRHKQNMYLFICLC
jgi:hypothetical protein